MKNEIINRRIDHAKIYLARGFPIYADLVSKDLSHNFYIPIEDLRQQIGLFQNTNFVQHGKTFFGFINSMPRSGSTAYRQCLFKSHPNLCFFSELYTVGTVYSPQDFDFATIETRLTGSKNDAPSINWSNQKKCLDQLKMLKNRYERFIEHEVNDSCFLVGDKRPYLFKSMPEFIGNFPHGSLKIVHILRNERDIIASGLARRKDPKDKNWRQEQDLKYLVSSYNIFLEELERSIYSEKYSAVHNIYVSYDNMFKIPNIMLVLRELACSLNSVRFPEKVIDHEIKAQKMNSRSIMDRAKHFLRPARLSKSQQNFITANINYELKRVIQNHLKIVF